MKKIISILLACMLLLAAAPALAATEAEYTMREEGTVLQNAPDRGITPNGELGANPVIPGESPTTGLPLAEGRYMPMLLQIDNPFDKKTQTAGTGNYAPWGGAYADIVYEEIVYGTGQTRFNFLFSDSFADNQPQSAGPVRSTRTGIVLLQQEWQGGLVFAGGPKREGSNIFKMLWDNGAREAGLVFDLLENKHQDYKYRVKGIKAPGNYNVNPAGMRSMIPATTVASPRPFLFADASPYADGYEPAHSINLDWGNKSYISHFKYDESTNLYLRYANDKPYMAFASAEDRSAESQTHLSFSNVIIQRVEYEYVDNNQHLPLMQSVGRGNADIFIAGRYIPGSWVREDADSPTIFFDENGDQLKFSRGKTFIAHFPPESLLTFQSE